MSAPSPNSLSLGANVNYTIDPTIPQSSQASVAQINDSRDQQLALINATTGGRRRRRRKSRRYYRGGAEGVTTIPVGPLPLGSAGANAQENNVAMSQLFANATSASTYDKVGGKRRRRRTNRRTYRRKTKRRRNRKSRKSRR
jgi:hypothetical protein